MKEYLGKTENMRSGKKKKVLIFIEDGSFTYDNRVSREANALNEAGWDVTVISPRYQGDSFYKEFHKNLRAFYYPKPATESIMSHLIEFFISLFLGSLLTLWVHIRYGFKVIHGCNPMDILWLVALPYKIIRKKFIFDQHDLVPELILSRGFASPGSLVFKIFVFFEKCSYKFADVVISTNESYKEIAISRGGKDEEDVFVVRNGPDLKKFKNTLQIKDLKNSNEILVGYLGNMNPQDGADYLLKAAEDIIKKRGISNIKFVFVGGGSSQQGLQDDSVKKGLASYVTFTGRIPDDEMLSTIGACDICVQPDPYNPLNDKSTMNKVLEYMALEKPVVAFDLKETRVSCGKASLYAKPSDVSELAEKIISLADNSDLRHRLGKIGRERIEKRLSWNFSVPHLLNAYRRVLEKKEKNSLISS